MLDTYLLQYSFRETRVMVLGYTEIAVARACMPVQVFAVMHVHTRSSQSRTPRSHLMSKIGTLTKVHKNDTEGSLPKVQIYNKCILESNNFILSYKSPSPVQYSLRKYLCIRACHTISKKLRAKMFTSSHFHPSVN